jgi:hypothetical protein
MVEIHYYTWTDGCTHHLPRGLRSLREEEMSVITARVAVAVSASRGVLGKQASRTSCRLRYDGRKSCPCRQ